MQQKLDIKTAKEFSKTLFAQKIQWDRANLIVEVTKKYEEKYGVKIKSQYTPDVDDSVITFSTN